MRFIKNPVSYSLLTLCDESLHQAALAAWAAFTPTAWTAWIKPYDANSQFSQESCQLIQYLIHSAN
jgi:hypothetical protein